MTVRKMDGQDDFIMFDCFNVLFFVVERVPVYPKLVRKYQFHVIYAFCVPNIHVFPPLLPLLENS